MSVPEVSSSIFSLCRPASIKATRVADNATMTPSRSALFVVVCCLVTFAACSRQGPLDGALTCSQRVASAEEGLRDGSIKTLTEMRALLRPYGCDDQENYPWYVGDYGVSTS